MNRIFNGLATLLLVSSACSGDPAEPEVIDDMGEEQPGEEDPGEEPGEEVPGEEAQGCAISMGVAGTLVVLHDADGAVLETAEADEGGVASWDECPADSMISYVIPGGKGWRGLTVAGIQPGSNIEAMYPDLDPVSTAMVDIPEDGADLTSIYANAGSACGGSGPEGGTAQVVVSTDCLSGSTDLPILARAYNGDIRMFSYSLSASLSDGEVAVEDMSGWTTGPEILLSVENAPDDLMMEVQPMKNGMPFGGIYRLGAADEEGNISQGVSSAPSAFTNLKRVGFSTNGLERRGIQRLTDQLGESFDAALLPPEVTDLLVDDSDPARLTVGPEVDYVGMLAIAKVSWTLGGEGEDGVYWQLLYPAADGSVTFPQLPAELAEYTPVEPIANVVDVYEVTGSDYLSILERGYTIEQFRRGCPALEGTEECIYTGLYQP